MVTYVTYGYAGLKMLCIKLNNRVVYDSDYDEEVLLSYLAHYKS